MDSNRMSGDGILDKELASLSNKAQELLMKNYCYNLYDVASIMCNDPDCVRSFENEVLSHFLKKDLIKLRKLLIKNNFYSKMRCAEHLKPVTRLQISVTADPFRPAGYLQAVTEEYTIDRIQGKIHLKHINDEGNIIKNINICVSDSEMISFFYIIDEIFWNGISLDASCIFNSPKYNVSVKYADNSIIDAEGYTTGNGMNIEYILKDMKRIVAGSI
ncbi:MAG: hypothetical protein PUB87_02545 [Eubacteriaceae bacterium]|nr:hypothetical protein [Eubacteriaceae bacterium]